MARTKLAAYRAKRDFKTTTEPSGETEIRPAEYPRFVIQKHDATRLHFDLRLEVDGVFKSWAVTRGPSLDPHDKRLAVEVEDHPLAYGDFEGTIPKGEYGGGTVMVWDRGFWMPEGPEPPAKAIEDGELKFVLAGDKLKGSWVLVRMKRDRTGGKRTNWLMIKHRDEFSRDNEDNPGTEDRSAASGRSMAEIAAGKGRGPRSFMLAKTKAADPQAIWHSRAKGTKSSGAPLRILADPSLSERRGTKKAVMPSFIAPQLCRAVSCPPDGEDWVHEVKLDGYRMQLRVENGKVALRTRKGLDWTNKFSEISVAARSLPDAIIDGEVAALNRSNVSDLTALRVALSEARTEDLIFFAFDLLHLNGEDLRSLPLVDRKAGLRQLLRSKASGSPTIRFIEHVSGHGADVLESSRRLGLEGIISKLQSAPYRSGRSDAWTKAKSRPEQEVVIGGWSGGKDQLRSLIAGVYRGNHLIHVGRVGTGYDAGTAKTLLKALNPLATRTSPFSGKGAPRREANVTWVKPKLVAEIEFAGWTGDGIIREAAFKGLREDKAAEEVRADRPVSPETIDPPMPSGHAKTRSSAMTPARAGAPVIVGVAISNPAKPLWPAHGKEGAVTKLDLVRYLEKMGPWMMEHLKGRPCSIVRAPDGVAAEQFFQRHAMPGMKRITLTKVAGDPKSYLQIDTLEGLVAMGQMAAVEFHPWNCHPFKPAVPGRLIFDLDPAPDVPFDAVIDAAKELRDRLEDVRLAAFCKTTGGKGLHVVVPLQTQTKSDLGWDEAKAFAQAVCAQMAADSPERYLIKMTKKLRTGRIFLDYLRNDRKSTAVAPLSPRTRPGAPVSMPIAWNQVRKGLDPQRFTIWTAPGLMTRSEAWKDYDDAAQPLEPAIRRLTGTKRQ